MLVELLGDPYGTESKAGEKAAAVLHDLAQDAEGRADIIAAGAIPPLVALLSGGPESKAAHWAAGTLSWLACKNEASGTPMVVAGAIPLLVALLRGGPESGAAAAAAVALSALVRSLRVYHTDVYTERCWRSWHAPRPAAPRGTACERVCAKPHQGGWWWPAWSRRSRWRRRRECTRPPLNARRSSAATRSSIRHGSSCSG